MKTNGIRATLIQISCSADPKENCTKINDMIRAAAAEGTDLVVLPELHDGRYFCQTEDPLMFDMAEPIPGPSTERLASLARECGVVIVSSLFERRAAGLYHNTAVVLERDGSIAGIYRKMHIPDDPGYYEKFYFAPGDLGFTPIDTSAGRLGVLICWDQWFPEAARLMALAGADILIYPTAIGWDPHDSGEEQARQRDAWITVQRGHAVANGLPVVTVNRVGREPSPTDPSTGQIFWGSSFVAGPQGELTALFSSELEETGTIVIDRNRTESVRRIWPFLRDRRIDAYQGLLRRYGS